MKNTTPWIIVICTITLFGHYFIAAENQKSQLKLTVELSDKAIAIEGETIRDLMHANRQISQEKEAIGSERYVAGVVDALQRPDHYDAIWHDGYNRGTETEQLAQASASESAKQKLRAELKTKQVSYPKK
jgi:hypothetical protein